MIKKILNLVGVVAIILVGFASIPSTASAASFGSSCMLYMYQPSEFQYHLELINSNTFQKDALCRVGTYRIENNTGTAKITAMSEYSLDISVSNGDDFTVYVGKDGEEISRHLQSPITAESDINNCMSSVTDTGGVFSIELLGSDGKRVAHCRFTKYDYKVLSGEAKMTEMNEYVLYFDGTKKGKIQVTTTSPSYYQAQFEIGNSVTSTSCTDSDGGKNYFMKGKGTGIYGGGNGVIWGEDSNKCSGRQDLSLNYGVVSDCCADSSNNNQLNEAYCDENGFLQSVGYSCPNGCKDGVCISSGSTTTTTIPPAGYEDVVITNPTAASNPFSDVSISSIEGKAAVELYRRAVIGGFSDGEFKGSQPVNRAEAAKFLLLARGITVGNLKNNGRFGDVKTGEWYEKFVMKAAEKGIINGNPDGTFRPANTVNTAEFLKMLTKTFNLSTNLPYTYSDVSSNAWFAQFAGVAQKYDLFPNRGSRFLLPSQNLTRNEVAVAIYQYLKSR
ncbi:MAG: S-layer homology domain-containing protein [Patescibacteria group bacterium]